MSALVHLWTDGSGTVSGQAGGWAYVPHTVHPITGKTHMREGSGGAYDTTNNRMELTALLEGLRALTRPVGVIVHADSQYVLTPLREGTLEQWAANNYRKKKNVDLWMQVREIVRPHTLHYHHVKGHSGVPLNERCDELAGMERRKRLRTLERRTPPPLGSGV